MDYSAQMEGLQRRAVDTVHAIKAAGMEDRASVQARIAAARSDVELAVKDAHATLHEAGDTAQSRWALIKAEADARLAGVKAEFERRRNEHDAKSAAADADWAEADAFDAIDYAEWAIDNARLSVLDAIDARLRADELAVR